MVQRDDRDVQRSYYFDIFRHLPSLCNRLFDLVLECLCWICLIYLQSVDKFY